MKKEQYWRRRLIVVVDKEKGSDKTDENYRSALWHTEMPPWSHTWFLLSAEDNNGLEAVCVNDAVMCTSVQIFACVSVFAGSSAFTRRETVGVQ